jgi:hypothetical protein
MALKSSNHSKNYSFKSEKKLYSELDIYMNKLIDEQVNQAYDPKYKTSYSFAQEAIFLNLFSLNNPSVIRDFQTILNSPLTANDAVISDLVRISADKASMVIAEIETERVLKNLEYVEKTLAQTKLDINTYNNAVSKLSPTSSRYDILEKSLIEGRMYSGRDLSYKELDNLAKNLENYKQNKIGFEEAQAINEEAIGNGLSPVYTHKRWIWSQLEKTRHSGMDGTIVPIGEKFVVVNEVTGDVDYLDFPGDVENYSNPGNVINCGCDVEYIFQEGYSKDDANLSESLDDLKLLDFKQNRHRF